MKRPEKTTNLYASVGETISYRRLDRCAAKLAFLNNGGGVGELRLFQAYLSEYKISMFTDRRGREVWFEGPTPFENENRYHLDLKY